LASFYFLLAEMDITFLVFAQYTVFSKKKRSVGFSGLRDTRIYLING